MVKAVRGLLSSLLSIGAFLGLRDLGPCDLEMRIRPQSVLREREREMLHGCMLPLVQILERMGGGGGKGGCRWGVGLNWIEDGG